MVPVTPWCAPLDRSGPRAYLGEMAAMPQACHRSTSKPRAVNAGFPSLVPLARQHLLKFALQHQPSPANANGGYLALLGGLVG